MILLFARARCRRISAPARASPRRLGRSVIAITRSKLAGRPGATGPAADAGAYRPILDRLPESVVVWNADGAIRYANRAAARLAGLSEEALLGRGFVLTFIAEQDRKSVLRGLAALTPSEDVFASEHRLTGPDGENRWLSWRHEAVFSARGRLIETHSSARDVSEEKRGRRALEEWTQRLDTVFELVPDGLYLHDLEGRILGGNRAVEALIGYSREEIKGKTFLDLNLLPPEQIPRAFELMKRVGEGEATGPEEFTMIRRDGARIEVEVREYRVEVGGEPAVLGCVRDIGDRKTAERLAVRGEEMNRRIAEAVPAGIIHVAADGSIERANEYAVNFLGLSLDTRIDRYVADSESETIHEDGRPCPIEDRPVAKCLETGRTQGPMTLGLKRPEGGTKWAVFSAAPVKNPESGAGAVLTFLDLTELRRAEQERDRLFNLSHDLLCIVDFEGRFRRVNPAFERTLGRPVEEFIGRMCTDFVHPDDVENTTEERTRLAAGGAGRFFENRYRTKDGAYKWLTWSAVPDPEEKVIYAVARDMTRRKRAEEEKRLMEEQLRQARKLEALGTLAGGIAHDFNNILTSILGFADLTADELPEDSPLRENIEEILRAGARAQRLIRRILTFSRKGEQERRPVAVSSIVEESLRLLRASLPATIEIEAHIDPDSGAVTADPTELQQVVMNLCTNAYHVMAESGGVIEVRLEPVEIEAGSARLDRELKAGPYVSLTVRDHGPGIDPAVAERIFEPFFTTKPRGKGSGMGLSVVHGVVTALGGCIRFENQPDGGAAFIVRLPRTARAVDEQAPPRERARGGTERILLVDDEEPIAALGRRMLEKLGYTVTATHGAAEALERLGSASERYDLVISDVTMPNLTGIDLARRLRRSHPELPVVLITGYSDLVDPAEFAALGVRELLSKPFSAAELSAAVRRALKPV